MLLRKVMFAAMKGAGIPKDFNMIDSWMEEFGKDTKDLPEQELALLDHELHGGKCLRCGKEWIKDGLVFKQACDCYCECPFCHRRMVVEEDQNIRGCLYCGGFQCVKFTKKTEYHGKTAEVTQVRCSGILRPMLRGWHCDECGTQYGQHYYWPKSMSNPYAGVGR